MREFIINAGELESNIKTLQPFMSKEEVRYYLCGIFFEWKEGNANINFVATDAHKICVLESDADMAEGTIGDICAIVPTSALKTILQMLKTVKKDWPVSIKFEDDNSRVWIDCLEQKAEFKCADGTYPDYRRVIPTEKPKFTIGLAKAQAIEATKAVSKHTAKEPMEWQFINAESPIKMVGDRKIVVIMPMRVGFNEIDLGNAA